MKIAYLFKNQFLLSAFFKGLTGLILFLSVSQLIYFLGDKLYGIWVMVLSMFQWSLFFDFGISNVLKTRMPEFIVKNETQRVNEYITTSYISTGVLAVLMFLTLLIVVFSVNLSAFLNLHFNQDSITSLFIINGGFFCINLVLSINKSLFIGVNKNHLSEQNATTTQLLFFALLIISIFMFKNEDGLLKLNIITLLNGIVTVTINLYYTYVFFKKYNFAFVAVKKFDFIARSKEVLSMGLKFMLIQSFMVIIFFSDPYLISHYLAPEEISKYDVITKLFQFPLLIILSALAPFWPFFAKKFHENDFSGMKQLFSKFHRYFLVIIFGIVLLGFLSNSILFLWINKENYVSVLVVTSVVIMTILRILFTFYANFFNGIGKLNSQIIMMGVAAVLKIPLTVFLFQKGCGLASVMISSCLFLLISSLLLFLQSKTILNGK